MKIFNLTLFLMICVCTSGFGSERSHREAAEKMIQLSGIQSNLINIISYQYNSTIQDYQNENIPEEAKEIYSKYYKKIYDLMKNELLIGTLKEDLIVYYVDKFSEVELNQINNFFQTESGKKFVQVNIQMQGTSEYQKILHGEKLKSKMNEIISQMKKELKVIPAKHDVADPSKSTRKIEMKTIEAKKIN